MPAGHMKKQTTHLVDILDASVVQIFIYPRLVASCIRVRQARPSTAARPSGRQNFLEHPNRGLFGRWAERQKPTFPHVLLQPTLSGSFRHSVDVTLLPLLLSEIEVSGRLPWTLDYLGTNVT
jgi:hypothetical protein